MKDQDKPRNLPNLDLIRNEQTNKAGLDGLDLSQLRLSQDFQEMVGVKKLLMTVPVRGPDRHWFVRVHQHEEWRLPTAVIELKEDREVYLVDRGLWDQLPGLITPKMLFTAVNRQGVVFVWPVRLPNADGRQDNWSRSALQAAELGMQTW